MTNNNEGQKLSQTPDQKLKEILYTIDELVMNDKFYDDLEASYALLIEGARIAPECEDIPSCIEGLSRDFMITLICSFLLSMHYSIASQYNPDPTISK